jgi:soluble lytic murein transglycosylase-like protein
MVAMCLVMPALSLAQIYVGRDPADSGAIVLSNHPSSSAPTLLLPDPSLNALDTAGPARGRSTALGSQPVPPALAELIRTVARDYAVTESLIKAVIAVESGFEARARSPKGAIGLMQVMPQTAQRFGVSDVAAVDANLRAGTAYLRWLLDLFAGDVSLALAAYNAGENAVMRAGWRVPNIPETQAYVPKVLSYLARYEAQAAVN